MEIRDSKLMSLAIRHVLVLVEGAQSDMVSESVAKEKGNITSGGNPLNAASSKILDAKRWLEAICDLC